MLQEIVDLAQIAGSLALVVTVLFLYREVKVSNRLTAAANNHALVEIASPFSMAIIQDRGMAELYVHGSIKSAEMDPVDRYRYKTLLNWWLIHHENIYYQWRKGLLEDRSYKPWVEDLKQFIKEQRLWLHWAGIRSLFQAEFATHVQKIIDRAHQDNDHPERAAG